MEPRRFGHLLVELGFVTWPQVQEALQVEPATVEHLGDALVSLGHLTRPQLDRASKLSAVGGGPREAPLVGKILLDLESVTPAALAEGLSSHQATGQRLGDTLLEQGAVSHRQLYEALTLQRSIVSPLPERMLTPIPARQPARPGEAKHLVVVDGSERACALAKEGLGARGFNVTAFSDPLLALKNFEALRPDLVLTDYNLPGFSATELCRTLKEGANSDVPFIILTADDADAQRVAALRAGADDFVSKSASFDELAARVDSVLRRTSQTERLRRLFARYTSDAVVDEILRTPDFVLSGERREVTVLFADIRNFTALSEALAPEEVMRLLNELLGGLADTVMEWGGTLDKFLGDGLLAIWGAPVSRADDAQLAVHAALQLLEVVRVRNLAHPALAPIELGIGLNTGIVIAGSVGSARRTEYTCIGDAVNVASRLCGLAAGGEVLVGERTAALLRGLTPLEALPPAHVKGKSRPILLYRVMLDSGLQVAQAS